MWLRRGSGLLHGDREIEPERMIYICTCIYSVIYL